MDASFREIMYMAATIYGEARGESYEGMLAVGWVIRNRVENPGWWGKNIISVCTKRYQFSCWNENDANYEHVKAVARQERGFMDKPKVQECVMAAIEVTRMQRCLIEGADHYHADGIVPAWKDDNRFVGKIGHHTFYKLGLKGNG